MFHNAPDAYHYNLLPERAWSTRPPSLRYRTHTPQGESTDNLDLQLRNLHASAMMTT